MENQDNQNNQETTPAVAVENNEQPQMTPVDLIDVEQQLEQFRTEQNLPFGILGAFGAAVIGAVLWATITVATEYQIGYMAIAVGFIVGFANRMLGKGVDQIFGIIGGVLALFGCVLGKFFSLVGFVAKENNSGYFDTFSLIDFGMVPSVMMEAFSPLDILFYGLAVYQGYKISFRVA
jgi:hypothetical protein